MSATSDPASALCGKRARDTLTLDSDSDLNLNLNSNSNSGVDAAMCRWRSRAAHNLPPACAARTDDVMRRLRVRCTVRLRHDEDDSMLRRASHWGAFDGTVVAIQRCDAGVVRQVSVMTSLADAAWRADDACAYRRYEMHRRSASSWTSVNEPADRALILDIDETQRCLARRPTLAEPHDVARMVDAVRRCDEAACARRSAARDDALAEGREPDQEARAAAAVAFAFASADAHVHARDAAEREARKRRHESVDAILRRLWIPHASEMGTGDMEAVGAHMRRMVDTLECAAAQRRCDRDRDRDRSASTSTARAARTPADEA